jgi:hypothetical protein
MTPGPRPSQVFSSGWLANPKLYSSGIVELLVRTLVVYLSEPRTDRLQWY